MKQTIPFAKKLTEINLVTCYGSLVAKLSQSDEIDIRGEGATWQETDAGLEINAPGDLVLRLPAAARLSAGTIHGNATIKDLNQEIAIGTVHGDLILKQIPGAKIGAVHGSLIAKQLTGPLEAGTAGGSCLLKYLPSFQLQEGMGGVSGKYISGDVMIDRLHGDLRLKRVAGLVDVRDCRGDGLLHTIGGVVTASTAGDLHLFGRLPEGKHRLEAEQDVIISWPGGEPLTVSGSCAALVNRLEWDSFTDTEEDGRFSGQIGEGGAQIEIKAGSRAVFKSLSADQVDSDEFSFEFDFDFGRDFGKEFEAFGTRMAGLGEQIAAQVSRKMADLSSQLEGQFKAMRKREEAVRKAKERVYQYDAPPPPPPPAPAAPPPAESRRVGDTETVDNARFKVLEMLENGNISVEEANLLLKALE